MAYSESRETLDRIRPHLLKLEMGQGDLFNVPPGMSARQFAYKIREAFYIANLFPNEYPALVKASQIFKVQVVNKRQVQCVLTDKNTMAKVTTGGTIEHGGETAGVLSTKVMGKQTAGSIIEHVLNLQRLQPSNAPMTWPEANLSYEDKTRLYTWTKAQTPPWILLIADTQVTLTRPSRDLTEDLGWNPTDDD